MTPDEYSENKTARELALKMFRVVNGPGDGGSEFEFNALNPGIHDGWLRLAKQQATVWRCFHCDKVFDTRSEARDHFGRDAGAQPACQISDSKLREMEEELRRYRGEDTDLHRQIAHLQSEHATALRREEEKGYAKALADMRELLGDTSRLNWLEKNYLAFTLEFPTLRGQPLRARLDAMILDPTNKTKEQS